MKESVRKLRPSLWMTFQSGLTQLEFTQTYVDRNRPEAQVNN